MYVRKRPIFESEELAGEIDSISCWNPCVISHESKVKVDGISEEKLAGYDSNDYLGVVKGGVSLSDIVTKGQAEVHATLEDYITSIHSKNIYFQKIVRILLQNY